MSDLSDFSNIDAQTSRKDDTKKILEQKEGMESFARADMHQIGLDAKQSNSSTSDKTAEVSNIKMAKQVEISATLPKYRQADTGPIIADQVCSFGSLRQRNMGNASLMTGRTEAAMLKEQDEERQLLRRGRETLTDADLKNIPRMVHRNMPFGQSNNDIAVTRAVNSVSPRLSGILKHDWYHVILGWPTALSLLGLLFIWTLVIIIFALIYRHGDKPQNDCGLGAKGETIGFSTAFAFSLETCTTVGYGLPNGTNGFFEPECGMLQFWIYLQMVSSMMFNGFLFAFMFARLARCESRAVQVLFSDKAIIEVQDGKWYMHVRVYDMDSQQPVVEAHIRMYCVSWRDYLDQTKNEVQPHLLHHMRILVPNDDLGSMMFTSIPANVTHHIDAYSPLTPLHIRKKVNVTYLGGVELREVDDMTGNRSDIPCPVCGETFGVVDHLERHIKYMRVTEEHDELPINGTHRDPTLVKRNLTKPITLKEKDIREHLMDKEIMCVVEAIEPMVSGTFQALQSYKLEDMVFGGRFAPCMSQKDGQIYVDVNKFHKIIPPSEASSHYYNNRG